jgi:pimeloyl-ACP methyl ester carboxylesterase
MRGVSRKLRSSALIVGVALAFAAAAPAQAVAGSPAPCARGHASHGCQVRVSWLPGYDAPGTPAKLDRVGVLKVGDPSARHILVLNPGTSGASGYFKPLADDIVKLTQGRWQVWSVERRENQLEDQSVLDQFKEGKATTQRLFNYYLGWLSDPSIKNHFQPIPDSSVGYARHWGMNVEIEDLHRVVEAAHSGGRTVVLGGHSLGGSITTAYATWDFGGTPGGSDLAGLVYIDGGSNPVPVTRDQATQSLSDLKASTPWLAFGGIPAPYLGLFSAAGSCGAVYDPNGSSVAYGSAIIPGNLKPSLPAGVVPTNEGEFGFATSIPSSPANLVAAQVHAGHLASAGSPRGWVRDGAITPIQRYAAMLCGKGLENIDGSAWYHPMRLSIDSGAVADGNANPAQRVLNVRAIHGHDLSPRTRIYAFGAALGGQGVLDDARTLAEQSGIPQGNLTLINRESTYSHNDANSASPTNAFVKNLIPFLSKVAGCHRHAGHHQGS